MSEILTPRNGEGPRDERPRLVLDTNTVLALWMFRDPVLDTLRAWIETGNCRLYSREDALEELRRVLAYRQFGLDTADQAHLLDTYRHRTKPAGAQMALFAEIPTCRDTDDQKFLELAVGARASFLITRDKALLHLARHRRLRDQVAILTPERLQEKILLAIDIGQSPAHFQRAYRVWPAQSPASEKEDTKG